MKNNYVLSHDFKFNSKTGKINKLSLRNIEDFKIYIEDLFPTIFNAEFKNNILKFNDGESFKIKIQENKPAKN